MESIGKAHVKMTKNVRGATMVEYALLIVAVMVFSATAYRLLGTAVMSNATKSTTILAVP